MHNTKYELIKRNGLVCMLCGRECDYKMLEWHHIIPKHVCKEQHKPIDDSYENGSLLCLTCHTYVHLLEHDKQEYDNAMQIVKMHKN